MKYYFGGENSSKFYSAEHSVELPNDYRIETIEEIEKFTKKVIHWVLQLKCRKCGRRKNIFS